MAGDYLSLALSDVNAPRPHRIDGPTLLACLRAARLDERWRPHVRAFLEELPVETIHSVVLEGHIGFPELVRAIGVWGCDNDDTRRWTAEMARCELEQAAPPRAAGAP